MQWIAWLLATPYRAHTLSFVIMVVCAILMVPTARLGVEDLVWLLIGLFALANLLILGAKP